MMWIASSCMLLVSPDPRFQGVETKRRSGTTVGDPIETNTAGEFYARKEGDLYVGSVKGNLGCVARPALPIDSDTNGVLHRCPATWSPQHSSHL